MKEKYIYIATGIWTLGVLGANLAALYYSLNVSNEYNNEIIGANIIAMAVSSSIFCKLSMNLYSSIYNQVQPENEIHERENFVIYPMHQHGG